MTNAFKKAAAVLLALAVLFIPLYVGAQGQNPPSNQSFVGGRFVARNYIYPGVRIFSGNNASGAATITLSQGSVRLPDGRSIVPFSAGGFGIQGQSGALPAIPIYVGAGTTRELVTPTAVTGCYVGAPQGTCQITATFANAHGQGEVVTSGSFGIQEALNDAGYFGGGLVVVDGSLNFVAGSAQTITSALIAANVVNGTAIEDTRGTAPVYWNIMAGATALATPAVLGATTVGFGIAGANFTGGTYTGSNTYIACITYVDIMGQEGPCSPTYTVATSGAAATDQIGFTAPPASAGAVGYIPYITLNGGSYVSAYKVPLITQPTVTGTYPVANGVCTLTTVETTTPACALTNATYNQTGSTAVVSALTVNTSPIEPEATVVSTTSIYVPNPGGRTTYFYSPAGGLGPSGNFPGADLPSSWLPFTISAAPATTVPTVVATVNLPAGFMNVLGKKIEVCGEMTTTATAATIVDVQFQWDAVGQNTAGKGVLIGDLTATPVAALATAGHVTFCQDFMTTVVGATATSGTINHVNSSGAVGGLTAVAPGALADAMTGATNGGVGSLNLAEDARLNIIYLHQTGTDGAGWIMQNLTIKQL